MFQLCYQPQVSAIMLLLFSYHLSFWRHRLGALVQFHIIHLHYYTVGSSFALSFHASYLATACQMELAPVSLRAIDENGQLHRSIASLSHSKFLTNKMMSKADQELNVGSVHSHTYSKPSCSWMILGIICFVLQLDVR